MAQAAAPTLPVFSTGIDYAGEKEKITTFFTQFVKQPRLPRGQGQDEDEDEDEDEGLALDMDDLTVDGDDEMPDDRKRFKYMKQLVSRDTPRPARAHLTGLPLHPNKADHVTQLCLCIVQTRVANRKQAEIVLELDDVMEVRAGPPPPPCPPVDEPSTPQQTRQVELTPSESLLEPCLLAV